MHFINNSKWEWVNLDTIKVISQYCFIDYKKDLKDDKYGAIKIKKENFNYFFLFFKNNNFQLIHIFFSF